MLQGLPVPCAEGIKATIPVHSVFTADCSPPAVALGKSLSHWEPHIPLQDLTTRRSTWTPVVCVEPATESTYRPVVIPQHLTLSCLAGLFSPLAEVFFTGWFRDWNDYDGVSG